MNPTIRTALAEEVPSIVTLWQAIDAFPESIRPFGGDSHDKPDQAHQLIKHALRSDKALVLVATIDDDIVGTISGHVFDKPAVNLTCVGVIYSLWVNEDHRSQGIGGSLLSTLETGLKHKGAKALQVGWDTANHHAELWWQKRGYSPYETIASKIIAE